jgi:hypothetical protein
LGEYRGTLIRWLSKESCNEVSEQALIMQLLEGGYIDKARTKKRDYIDKTKGKTTVGNQKARKHTEYCIVH